jgi:hypothetical protein
MEGLITMRSLVLARVLPLFCIVVACSSLVCGQGYAQTHESTLSPGWDDLNEPLSSGKVLWTVLDNGKLDVTFQLNGASPNHRYIAGVHFFDPGGFGQLPGVCKFGGTKISCDRGPLIREGITATVIGAWDFGVLETNGNGYGKAQFTLSPPEGTYHVQFTVRMGDQCNPAAGQTSNCAVVFRTGTNMGEGFDTITIPLRVIAKTNLSLLYPTANLPIFDWGSYFIRSIGGEDYFAGYVKGILKNASGKFEGNEGLKVLENSDQPITITGKNPLALKDNYALSIKSIDSLGNKVYLELLKDGQVIDAKAVSPSKEDATTIDKTYYYKNPKLSNLITIAVHFKNAFNGADPDKASIDGVWQISEYSLDESLAPGIIPFSEPTQQSDHNRGKIAHGEINKPNKQCSDEEIPFALVGTDCKPLPSTFTFIEESVKSQMGDIDAEELQGLANSDTNWYWITRTNIYKVPIGPKGSNFYSPITAQTSIGGFLQTHFGDADFFEGKLYVPLTQGFAVDTSNCPEHCSWNENGEQVCQYGDLVCDPESGDPETGRNCHYDENGCAVYTPLKAIVLVYDENLNLLSWGELRTEAEGAWVAINPLDGMLYTGLYTGGPYGTLNIYDPNKIDNNKFEYKGQITLKFTNVPSPEWVTTTYGEQGGDFSPNGIFYNVLDHGKEAYSPWTGVHAFRVIPFNMAEVYPDSNVAREITLTGIDPFSPAVDYSNCPEHCSWNENGEQVCQYGDLVCDPESGDPETGRNCHYDENGCAVYTHNNANFLHVSYEPCWEGGHGDDGSCSYSYLVGSFSSRGDELEGLTVFRNQDGTVSVILTILGNSRGEDDMNWIQWSVNEP